MTTKTQQTQLRIRLGLLAAAAVVWMMILWDRAYHNGWMDGFKQRGKIEQQAVK
jgi:hypothetical protein